MQDKKDTRLLPLSLFPHRSCCQNYYSSKQLRMSAQAGISCKVFSCESSDTAYKDSPKKLPMKIPV